MTSRIYAHVRADKAVITNRHHSLVEHRPVEISKETSAYPNVFAIVAEERLVDKRIVITAAKNLVQLLIAFLDKSRTYLVVLPAAVFTQVQVFQQTLVNSIIHLATEHLFVFSLHILR